METNQDAEIGNSSVFDYGQCTKEVKTQEVYENLLEVATAAICKASRGSPSRSYERSYGEIVYQNSSKSISTEKSLQFFTPCALNSIRDVDSSPLHRVDALAFHGLQKKPWNFLV